MGALTTLGIDPSLSNTAVVLAVEGVVVGHKLLTTNPKDSKEARIYHVTYRVRKMLQKHQPDFTIIEGYSFASLRSNAATTLHELGGALRQVFYRLEIPWHEVPPTTIKAFAGHGRASKEEMIAWAKREWKGCPNQADVADAFWCSRYAYAKYDQLVTPIGGDPSEANYVY